MIPHSISYAAEVVTAHNGIEKKKDCSSAQVPINAFGFNYY